MKIGKINIIIFAIIALSYAYFNQVLTQSNVSTNPAKGPKTVNIINGTEWEMSIAYTTSEGVSTNDSIPANGSKQITTKDENIRYSLIKEQGKIKTDVSVIPVSDIEKGTYQLTPDAEIIKKWTQTHPAQTITPPVIVVPPTAPATHTATNQPSKP